MMDLMLPGREPEPEDYEAQAALRTLLESEKIKHCGDEDLLSRIAEHIRYNQDMLARIYSLVESFGGEEAEEEEGEGQRFGPRPTEERTDTRTIDDFLLRINRARKEEYRKTIQPIQGGKRYG